MTIKRIAFAALVAFALTACSSNENTNNTTDNTEQQGKEYTSAYICPMHCEGSGSDAPGKCPACDMDYVENEAHSHDGHDHSDDNHSH